MMATGYVYQSDKSHSKIAVNGTHLLWGKPLPIGIQVIVGIDWNTKKIVDLLTPDDLNSATYIKPKENEDTNYHVYEQLR